MKNSIYSILFPATWGRRTTETTPGHETELPAARSLCCRDQLVGKWPGTVARGSGAAPTSQQALGNFRLHHRVSARVERTLVPRNSQGLDESRMLQQLTHSALRSRTVCRDL